MAVKFQKINIEDAFPSAQWIDRIVKETLQDTIDSVAVTKASNHAPHEGLYGEIQHGVDDVSETGIRNSDHGIDTIIPDSDDLECMGLPLSFSSTKSTRKRKRKRKDPGGMNQHEASAKIKRKFSEAVDAFTSCVDEPPEGVMEKYWDQRYRLMSKYDHGVRLDAESWYSITPEEIADHIARRCRDFTDESSHASNNDDIKNHTDTEGMCVLDGFCGCGGNAIAFAKHYANVIAVDIDPCKVDMCKHNTSLYGVRVDVKHGDLYNILQNLPTYVSPPSLSSSPPSSSSCLHVSGIIDACLAASREVDNRTDREDDDYTDETVIKDSGISHRDCGNHSPSLSPSTILPSTLSPPPKPIYILSLAPPWGGPGYTETSDFDISSSFPSGNGYDLAALSARISENLVYMLPRNTSRGSVRKLQRLLGMPAIAEEICLHGKPKLIVMYCGPLFAKRP
jgi:hypothetical protein